jgi:two-component system response regulator
MRTTDTEGALKMADTPAGSIIKILLIDDSPGDIRLTTEALKESRLNHQLIVAQSSREALALLRNGVNLASGLPDIILLDINLPERSGLEILAEIKSDEYLKKIPVVMLTTSGEAADVRTAYDLHANCYIVKPTDFDKFIQVIQSLENFWVSVAKLPGT